MHLEAPLEEVNPIQEWYVLRGQFDTLISPASIKSWNRNWHWHCNPSTLLNRILPRVEARFQFNNVIQVQRARFLLPHEGGDNLLCMYVLRYQGSAFYRNEWKDNDG